MLIIVTAFAIVAVARGQDIYKVGLDGQIEFYSRHGGSQVDRDDIQSKQDTIENHLEQVEREARQQGEVRPQSETASIGGSWTGGSARYLIQQYGDKAVIIEQGPYGITAYGVGTVAGSEFLFDYEVYDGSVGRGYLALAGGLTLRGQFTNLSYDTTVEAVLVR